MTTEQPEPGRHSYERLCAQARHAIDEQGKPHEEPPWSELDATEKMAWSHVERAEQRRQADGR